MRHNFHGRKLNRTKSHREAMLSNMAASLFEFKKIHTTEAKAKELRPFAEVLVTKAKNALNKENQNLLPTGQTIDIHNRRLVARTIRNKAVIQELFDVIAPKVSTRNGGYLRITKTGTRRGDAARTAIIEFVDWSAPQDGAITLKRKKKKTSQQPTTAKPISAKKEKTTTKDATTKTTTNNSIVEVVDAKIEPSDVVEVVEATTDITEKVEVVENLSIAAQEEVPTDETKEDK